MTSRTMLQFDYENIHGQTVMAVVGQLDGPNWIAIALVVGHQAVRLLVDPDTDEISVGLVDASTLGDGWTEVAELSEFLGSLLGWCRVGRNYLGYLDMFTLSFAGLEPQVCFVGEAAHLTIRRIVPAH